MPHTVSFSRQFRDKLSYEVVDELVDWLNTVDLTYKSELRELNEISLQRLEATIRSQFDTSVADLRGETTAGFAKLRGEMEAGEARLRTEIAISRVEVDATIANLRSDMEIGFANQRVEWKSDIAGLRGEMVSMRADMIKWMFVFWASSALIMIGLA